MSYRYHGRAMVDASWPRAWGICDRCSGLYNLSDLRYQFQFNGTMLYNTRFRVCPKCMDIPQPQLLNPILPPDPMPVIDPRPPRYAVDEQGPSETMQAQMITAEEAIGAFYLDLYYGNPAQSGSYSVLGSITGSATRTNFAASMSAPIDLFCINTVPIVFTTSSRASTNVTWVAAYDAPTGGSLLMSGALFNPLTAVLYNGLEFGAGGLQVVLTQYAASWDDAAALMWGNDTFMVWG